MAPGWNRYTQVLFTFHEEDSDLKRVPGEALRSGLVLSLPKFIVILMVSFADGKAIITSP